MTLAGECAVALRGSASR